MRFNRYRNSTYFQSCLTPDSAASTTHHPPLIVSRQFVLMVDVVSKRKRSEVMSLIRSRGNRETELRLIEIFRKFGVTGWRRGVDLPGKPDFVFRTERMAVFVDGCFWHGCPRCYRRPKSNQVYW